MYLTLDWLTWMKRHLRGDQTYYPKDKEHGWESQQLFCGRLWVLWKAYSYFFRICISLELEIEIRYEQGTSEQKQQQSYEQDSCVLGLALVLPQAHPFTSLGLSYRSKETDELDLTRQTFKEDRESSDRLDPTSLLRKNQSWNKYANDAVWNLKESCDFQEPWFRLGSMALSWVTWK